MKNNFTGMQELKGAACFCILVLLGLMAVAGCSGRMGAFSGAESAAPPEPNFQQQARAAFAESRFAEAAQLFSLQAQSHEGEEHKAWFNAGASYWNANQQKQALQIYEQAVASAPLYFRGHKRLAIRYESIGLQKESEQHRNHALAIRKVEHASSPLWEKANSIRGRGIDWFKAAALVHDKVAQAYESLGYPEFAKVERQLADQKRMEEATETAKLQQMRKQPQMDAQNRAQNTQLLSSLTNMTAHGFKTKPFTPMSMHSSQNSTTQGMNLVQQAYGGYSQLMGSLEQGMQQQREATYQQGQQAQAALVQADQVQAQQRARDRTDALQRRLQQAEQEASEYLAEQGLLDTSDVPGDKDTLDL